MHAMRRGTGQIISWVRSIALAGVVAAAACSADRTASDSRVHVTIEPEVVTVVAGTSQTFVAAVTGTTNPVVTWSVEEGGVGGEISSTGVYRAPMETGMFQVSAASRADPSRRRHATVTVVPPQPISVTITSPATPVVTLPPDGRVAFLAAVRGAGNRTVRWTIDTGQAIPGGSITVEGVYTAPALDAILPYLDVAGSITVIVRARSLADPTKSATRPVVIQSISAPVTISPPRVAVGLGGLVAVPLSIPVPSTWTVNGEEGGNPDVGTTSAFGGYRAPLRIPDPPTVMIGSSATTAPVWATVVSRFLPPEVIPVQTCLPSCPFAKPAALAAADFNGDGLFDLATANPASGTLSVLMAADSGHFAAPYRVPVGAADSSGPRILAAAGLNGDQPADLMTATIDAVGGAVRTRLAVGDGTFGGETASILPARAAPVAAAFGAFNGDAIPDLVVADAATHALHLLGGQGGGVFSPHASLADAAKIPRPAALAVADFDGNGRDDVAVAAGDHTVSIWLTNADGTLRYAQTVAFQTGRVATAVVAGDFNRDAAPDLLITLDAPSGVSVVLNVAQSQTGLFGSPSSSTGGSSAAAIGDFNRDGFSDAAVADRSADTVTTYFGDGGLARSETYLVGAAPEAVATGDFNGDGWDDIAVANGDDTVYVFRNRGDPTAP
jgi:hypothetical protein